MLSLDYQLHIKKDQKIFRINKISEEYVMLKLNGWTKMLAVL